MDLLGQLVTIAAVLLGGLVTHYTNHAMERHRTRYTMLTRWDERKLDAYAEYIDRVRSCIYAAVLVYETRQGMRTVEQTEQELTEALVEAGVWRGRAFERIMLLAEDGVIEAAHNLNATAHAIDWRARGVTNGPLEDWRALHRKVFQEINRFHEAARKDLGVSGSFQGDEHGAKDLILPSTRQESDG